MQLPPHAGAALPVDAPLFDICRACASDIPWIDSIACTVCGRPETCGDCARRRNAHFVCSRSAVRYSDRVREWVALFKYRGDERLAGPLADMLDLSFLRLELTLRGRVAGSRWDAVVPVPVSDERLAERGFNQAERLAALLCARRGLPMRRLLLRTRHSEKKSLQSRLARLKSAEGLFVADDEAVRAWIEELLGRELASLSADRPARRVRRPVRLLLVDDIYTTGSTIEACSEAIAAALRRHWPGSDLRVYAVTLARS